MPLKLATALICAAVLGGAQTSNPTSTTVAPSAPRWQPLAVSGAKTPVSSGQDPVKVDPEKTDPTKTNPVKTDVPKADASQDQPQSLPVPATGKKAKPPATNKNSSKKDLLDDGTPKPTTSIQEARTTYVIGPLDVLQIKVWHNPDLSNLYDVRPDGMISMPLVGEVKADGLTVEQLKAELSKKIEDAGQKTPDVDVQVPRINSKKYYITGGVRKTGEFPLPQPITILDALMNAGGFTDFANKKKIFILRGTHKYFFNYNDAMNGKHPEQNIVVMPNDKIVVPD